MFKAKSFKVSVRRATIRLVFFFYIYIVINCYIRVQTTDDLIPANIHNTIRLSNCAICWVVYDETRPEKICKITWTEHHFWINLQKYSPKYWVSNVLIDTIYATESIYGVSSLVGVWLRKRGVVEQFESTGGYLIIKEQLFTHNSLSS